MNILKSSQVLSKPIVLCIDYIYSHIHFRITLKELAEYLNLSESYLSKLFHQEMGISLSQYILDLKIEKAKNLLQYSDYNIVDIANYLSFSSQSHFIQVFQKKTGLTPHRYRTKHFRTNWDKVSVQKQNYVTAKRSKTVSVYAFKAIPFLTFSLFIFKKRIKTL